MPKSSRLTITDIVVYQIYKNASKLLVYPRTNKCNNCNNNNNYNYTASTTTIFHNHNNNTNTTHKANSTTKSPKVTLPIYLKAKQLTHCRHKLILLLTQSPLRNSKNHS